MSAADGRVYDRLVVGAGMSGLAYAWWGRRQGLRVAVLEASSRVGGVIESERRDGYLLEWGASTLPQRAPHTDALLASLPTPPRVEPASPAARTQLLWSARGLVPVPRTPRDLLRTSVLGPGARLRLLAEGLRGRRRPRRSETLEAYIQRTLGASVAHGLLGPFTTGIYGAGPEELGAADAFPALRALEQRHGGILRGAVAAARARGPGGRAGARRIRVLPDGMASLPEAIAEALGADVRRDTTVERVEPGTAARGAAVVTTRGERIEAREVALAVPAAVQARWLRSHAAGIAEILEGVGTTPILVAAVGLAPATARRLPPAFGFLRGPRAPGRILGATFRSVLSPDTAPPEHGLLQVYLGGSADPGALALDDAQVQLVLEADLGRALGARPQIPWLALRRLPHAIPRFAPGHRGRMARAQAWAGDRGIRLLGSHATGVGVERCNAAGAPLRAAPPTGLMMG